MRLSFAACFIHLLSFVEATPRTFGAWANSKPEVAQQLRNASWAGVFDVVQGVCGGAISVVDGVAEVTANKTMFAACGETHLAAKAAGAKFTLLLGGPPGGGLRTVPQEAIANPSTVISSAIALAKKLGLDGYNIDDESECAPRADLTNLTSWVGFINAFADGLHGAGLTLTSDIQAIFGVLDRPYESMYPCKLPPWQYKPDPRVRDLLSSARLDRWIEMDTYYFTLSRYLDSLDWYASNVPLDRLGVGIAANPDIKEMDQYTARFHALEKSGAQELNFWIMPVDDVWLPFIKRWKTKCAGCPNAGALSCYELAVPCDSDSPSLNTAAPVVPANVAMIV